MDDSATAEGVSAPAESAPAETEVQTQPETAEANVSDEATEADTEQSGDENTEQKEEPKRNRFQERISELTGRAKEAESRLAEINERYEQLQRMVQQEQPQGELRPPSLEECGYDEQLYAQRTAEYHHALNQNALSEFRQREQLLERQRAQEELNRAVTEQFQARQSAFIEQHPDYVAKVSDPAFVQADHVAHAIRMDENGPALAYHLAQNPQITDALNRMNPVTSLLEMGRLSAKLSAPPPVTTTQTPAPAAPVKPTGTPQKDPDKMSAKEYANWRNKQLGLS
jgi:hypothetical protein